MPPHAHRIASAPLAAVNTALRERFTLDAAPLQSGASGLIVADKDHRQLPEPLRSDIITAALPMLHALPDIAFVESRDRVLADPLPITTQAELLSLRERMRLSAVAERWPDIVMVRAANVTGGGRVGGNIAGHGTPWDYDRRVPIIFWKPGATMQERFLPIQAIDIAPTLATTIGIQPPPVSGRYIPLWD